MIGYPLDSHVTFKTDGTPVFDRAISSAPYRKLIKSLFSDGVLPNPSTNLQVSAGTGMKVNLYAGFAICNGCQKLQESNTTLDIATASAVNDRIDTVVLRLNDNDDVRECEFYVLTGTPAVAPVRPALTQTDSIWEIGLADVLVKANSTQISNANITDTRYETARCGVISSISEFDTTTLYQQIQSDLQEFREVNQANFIAWVESLKSKLDEDVAANLQLQIDEINENHQLKTYLSPKLMDSTKDWSNFALKDLKAGRKLVATLAAAEDISNAYANGVIPVAVAGTLTGINANNTGYYQYVTITGETYINSSESILGNVFTGWKQMVDILSSKEEGEANTTAGKVVDALVVKDINSSLTANDNQFYFDYQDGKYGYNTDPNRGADTFSPFSNGGLNYGIINVDSSKFNTDIIVHSVNLGYKPTMVCIVTTTSSDFSSIVEWIYCFDLNSTKYYYDHRLVNFGGDPNAHGLMINSITDTGFSVKLLRPFAINKNYYWVAGNKTV